MNRLFVALLGAVLAIGFGCSDSDKDSGHHHDKAMKASMDACPHCPGMQTATADGKCPVCGMKVSDMKKGEKAGAMSDKAGDTSMAMDACPHCPGKQTATADGKCPVCGAEVAKK